MRGWRFIADNGQAGTVRETDPLRPDIVRVQWDNDPPGVWVWIPVDTVARWL